jgi:Icc-related predicted phosphoesterase
VEDTIYNYQGVRILGLGGCIRYKAGPDQYTEQEMEKRIRKLRFQLLRNGGFDILLTHSPLRGIGDADDPTHRGFECLKRLLEDYEPKYMVHGHVHLNYGANRDRINVYGSTKVINAYEKYEFEY